MKVLMLMCGSLGCSWFNLLWIKLLDDGKVEILVGEEAGPEDHCQAHCQHSAHDAEK